jgi:ribonuclease P/MRP protein subunit RPP1
MEFYDLCVRVENHREATEASRELGWNGLGLLVPYSVNCMRELGELRDKIKSVRGIDLGLGVEIATGDSRLVKKAAGNVRRDVELVVVRGSTPEVNRAALETPEVDVLTHQGGMEINHVLARLAARNRVAVGFVFSGILLSYKKTRISLFSGMMRDAGILRKYRAPFIISSGSLSAWDLRSPSDLLAFGKLLGFPENQAREGMSGSILQENRKRLGKKWIMPGVEIE